MKNLSVMFVFLMWVGSGVYTWFKGGYSAWFLSYSLSLLLVYLFIVRMTRPKMISQRKIASEKWISGDDIVVKVKVQLQTWVPFVWIVIEDEWHKQTYFSFFQSTFQYRYCILDAKRGKYQSEGLQVVVKDLFGFVRKKGTIQAGLQFTVYPNPLSIDIWRNIHSNADDSQQTKSQKSHESLQFGGIRDYSHGDPMNRIHWKMSAKSNTLKTKEREHTIDHKMMIYLDAAQNLSHMNPFYFEMAVKISAGLLKYGKERQYGLGFICNNQKRYKESISSTKNAQQTHEFLSTVMPDGDISFHETIRHQIAEIPKDVANVCITAHLDDQFVQTCLYLRKHMRKINIVFIYGGAVLSFEQRKYIKALEEIGCHLQLVKLQTSNSKAKQGGLKYGA
ncbi:DUF58 domain-containing protein [Chengkuizengella axinellae]|uniref:DUF58 domain-containing protein n=1 Tax=Chengkuizengella axinellae TaxID=3064388 RepID=A0ABT9J1I9_9BACL|nr:DUF58 domain-containing protein [Chengkuizengella sp. 2205SS18-9]MDP5274874.1 DUF58 domain-containing protein [Chengkuizengella sp. 2205SS18-9]